MGDFLYICNMNYQLIHDSIIDRAKTRVLPKEVYTERHHIIPRCMNGTDDKSNLVDLTAREHFIVHKLLVEIYPDIKGLWSAYFMMMNAKTKSQGRNYVTTSSEYERVKLICAQVQSDRMKGRMVGEKNPRWGVKLPLEIREKISAKHKGKVISKEHKDKLSKLNKGCGNHFFGKTHNEETRKKISELATGRKLSEETRNKISDAHKGLQSGDKHGMFGKKHTDNAKQKISSKVKGEKNGFFGKTHNEETRKKIGNTHKGKKLTQEHIDKIKSVNTGRLVTEETRKKLSDLNKGENNAMFGKPAPNRKKVLNTKTGVIYDSIKEASIKNNINVSTLRDYLSGKSKNKTTLVII
jgi:hypothetical protein